MDILKKYNEETVQASPQAPQWKLSGEYGAITNAVIRLSGGAVRDGKQASYVLLAIAVVIIGVSLYFSLFSGGSVDHSISTIPPELVNKIPKIR